MATTSTKAKPSQPLPLPRPRATRPPRLQPGAHSRRPPTARALAVLGELEALFKAEGFAHLTAEELAARLRCSRRMLYQLAPSLDELAALVVDRFFQHMGRTCFAMASAGRTRTEQLDAYMRSGNAEFATLSPTFNRDMQALPATRRLADAHLAFGVTIFESILELGVDEGDFAPINPSFVARMFLAGLLRLLDPQLLRETNLTVPAAIDEYANLILNGIRRR
jgi:AcrR family transcriptional regulator